MDGETEGRPTVNEKKDNKTQNILLNIYLFNDAIKTFYKTVTLATFKKKKVSQCRCVDLR